MTDPTPAQKMAKVRSLTDAILRQREARDAAEKAGDREALCRENIALARLIQQRASLQSTLRLQLV